MGIEKLDEYAAKFGLGQKTGVELSEAAGVVASPEFTESLGARYEGNVLSVATVRRSTQVTPSSWPTTSPPWPTGGRAIPPTC